MKLKIAILAALAIYVYSKREWLKIAWEEYGGWNLWGWGEQ